MYSFVVSLIVIYLLINCSFAVEEYCSDASVHIMLVSKPSAKWHAKVQAFSLVEHGTELSNNTLDFEQFIHCSAVINYYEKLEKVSFKAICDEHKKSSNKFFCLKIFDNKTSKNGNVKWKVTNYAHLSYLVVNFSCVKRNTSGFIIFVNSQKTWIDNQARFSKVVCALIF